MKFVNQLSRHNMLSVTPTKKRAAIEQALDFFEKNPGRWTKLFYAKDAKGSPVALEKADPETCSYCLAGRVAFELGSVDGSDGLAVATEVIFTSDSDAGNVISINDDASDSGAMVALVRTIMQTRPGS